MIVVHYETEVFLIIIPVLKTPRSTGSARNAIHFLVNTIMFEANST